MSDGATGDAVPRAVVAAIRERWAKATPGPWRVERDRHNGGALAVLTDGAWGCQTLLCYRHLLAPGDYGQFRNPADAKAVAAAPEDIRWLIGEVERLTVALAEAARDRAADAAVLAALVADPWAAFHADAREVQYSCAYCTAAVSIGNDAAPTVLPAHDADCPIARARVIPDARRAVTTTGEDADGADAGR